VCEKSGRVAMLLFARHKHVAAEHLRGVAGEEVWAWVGACGHVTFSSRPPFSRLALGQRWSLAQARFQIGEATEVVVPP
jgi:hypothetical protein